MRISTGQQAVRDVRLPHRSQRKLLSKQEYRDAIRAFSLPDVKQYPWQIKDHVRARTLRALWKGGLVEYRNIVIHRDVAVYKLGKKTGKTVKKNITVAVPFLARESLSYLVA